MIKKNIGTIKSVSQIKYENNTNIKIKIHLDNYFEDTNENLIIISTGVEMVNADNVYDVTGFDVNLNTKYEFEFDDSLNIVKIIENS